MSEPHHRDSTDGLRCSHCVFDIPDGRKLEVKMFWRNIADATIEATLVCTSVLGMVLVGLPFFLVVAAIVTALLGVQPSSDDLQTVATAAGTPPPLHQP